MRRLLLTLAFLFAAPLAFGQTYSLYQTCELKTALGQAVSGAQVWVLTQPANTSTLTPLATIYSNSTGAGGPVTQPISTNQYGECSAYATPGVYTVVYNSPYTGQLVFPDQVIPSIGGGGSGNCTAPTAADYFIINTGAACGNSLADYNKTTPFTFTFPDSFTANANTNSAGTDSGSVNLLATDTFGLTPAGAANINIIATESGTTGNEQGAADVQIGSIDSDPNDASDESTSMTIFTNAASAAGPGNIDIATLGVGGGIALTASQGAITAQNAGQGNILLFAYGGVNLEPDFNDIVSTPRYFFNSYVDWEGVGGLSLNDNSTSGIQIDEAGTGPMSLGANSISLYALDGVYLGGSSGVAGTIQLRGDVAVPTVPTGTIQLAAPSSTIAYTLTFPDTNCTGFLYNPGSGLLGCMAGNTNISGGVLGSSVYQSAPGVSAVTAANTTTGTLCLTETGTGSAGAAPVWGACSGSSATAFSAITASTNTGQALVIGNGSTLGTTGTGAIVATTAAALASTPTLCSTGSAPTGILPNGNATGCASIGGGSVTAVTGTAPVVSSGGATPAISMAAASASVNGYLTSANWTTFNGKQAALGFTPAHSGANADISSLSGLTTPLSVPQGGVGVGTLTGYVYGNGTSAMSASTTIPGSVITGNIAGDAANLTAAALLPNGTAAATQSANDNSTKLATTAYVAAPGVISPTGITMTGAGVATILLPPATFATLSGSFPCNSGSSGRHATVSDSTTVVWGATITGGGSNTVSAFCDGSSYTVEGK